MRPHSWLRRPRWRKRAAGGCKTVGGLSLRSETCHSLLVIVATSERGDVRKKRRHSVTATRICSDKAKACEIARSLGPVHEAGVAP
jgi:hypothetical protein